MESSKVIAICGIPGSGKSSLVAKLASLIPESRPLRIDDYFSQASIRSDKTEWIRNGARFEDIKTPGLSENLSDAIADPGVSHVILEEARGRFSAETAPHITHLVYIDIPPDLALARRILQISENISDAEAIQYCRHYLHCVMPVIRIIDSRIKPQADLIVNGLEPLETLAQRVIQKYELIAH